MKKILCTLFAAAVVAAMSAVTAFAEDNLIFIKTAPTPKEVTEYAEKTFKEHPHKSFMISGIGLTEEQQKNAVLGNPIIVKGIYDDGTDDYVSYAFPIMCGGKFAAFMSLSEVGGSITMGQWEIEDKLNGLDTSPTMPAEIYAEGDKFGTTFAAVGDEVIVLRNMFDKNKTEQIEAIKKLRGGEDDLEKEYVINVYGYSKTGWISADGNTFYIRKNGTLAAENTIIGGVFYKFGEDGKYLGTYTGFARSGGKRCYYRNGVKLTGDFTVDGTSYRADKNGNILTDEKPVYVKTAPVPKSADDYAKDIFANIDTYDLTSIGLTKAEAKSAKLGSAFVITSLSSDGKPVDAAECYYYPVVCGGDVKAFLTVNKTDGKYGWQLGVDGIEEKFNSLDTSYDDPAEIYYVDGICIAASNRGMTVLSALPNYNAQKETAALETLRGKNALTDFVINAYGNSRVSV